MTPRNDRVILAHGGGGELTDQLIRGRILPRLTNDLLAPLDDSAVLVTGPGRLCLTTDAYVVTPLEFPGGDIGRLAVCGTVNDLAVAGATPQALSLAVIMEEGLELAVFDRVLDSIAAAAAEAGVVVATGDTKVIERRTGGGLMLTTAGVGPMRDDVNLTAGRIAPGDVVLINGPIAEHGLAVMSAREGLSFATSIRSDAAPLGALTADLLDSGADVRFLRDPTRGGLAGVLADLADATGLSIELDEQAVPLTPACRSAAEMLGLDPLNVANEGKLVAVVADDDADDALAALRRHPLGASAAAIATFTEADPPLVELLTAAGGRRIVQKPYGEDLPRIC